MVPTTAQLQCGPTAAQQMSKLLPKHVAKNLKKKKNIIVVFRIPNATHNLQLEHKLKKILCKFSFSFISYKFHPCKLKKTL